MRRITSLSISTALLMAVSACASPTDNSQTAQPVINELPRALSSEEQLAAAATTEFGLSLFRTVNAQSARDSNIAVSPISASLALGMLMNGAELETLAEVRQVLAYNDRPVSMVNAAYKALIPLLVTLDPSVKMSFANATWFDSSAAPSTVFSQAISDVFDAKVSTVRLMAPATAPAVNAWVSAATNGRIPQIVDAFRPEDIALLVNATYFKGQWRARFDAAKTQPAAFQVSRSASIQVPTMNNDQGLVRLGFTTSGVMVGEMPFGGDAFAMTFVVPPIGTIESVIDSLSAQKWREYLQVLPREAGKLTVRLPKFRLETKRQLNDALMALGMRRSFINAQLNPMFVTPSNSRAVSSVLQKVFVDVNEEGAEAAAATSIGIIDTALPPSLTVDRPFLFCIRERLTGTILFVGKVVRPVAP